jgi:hydrogenase expression/formation protein HypC
MCLALPGKIVSVISEDGGLPEADVSFEGVCKRVCIACTPDAAPGDYVLVHAGLAICRIDENAAKRTLQEFGSREICD